MTLAAIDFSNKQATGQEVLGGAPGVAINVVVDATGAVRRRPGIQAAPNIFTGVVDATGISGLYGTIGGQLYAVGSTPQFRQIYVVGVAVTPLGAPTSDATLSGALRPVFAETQLLLVMAGGGAMQKVVLQSNVASRLGGQPPLASHVAANSSRLLGNLAAVAANNTFDLSVVRFSDIANGNASFSGMEVWTEGLGTAGHFSCEADPDPCLAVYQNTNEVFCFGNTSLQIFDPDPSAVYAPATTRELGCSAPYSIVEANQQFAWLDNLRRFVVSDGRSEQVISDPIKKTLDDMTTVSDCYGFRFVQGPVDAFVWTFPTDGRTFAFQKDSGWAEWLGWSVGNWARFQVNAAHIWPATHDVMVGTLDGHVGRLSLDSTTDLGATINAQVETGYLNRGTDTRKKCNCVYVALRRGQTASSSAPVGYLSWRDSPGPYCSPIPLDFGLTGDTEIVLDKRSLGVYRRRQWKFEFAGTDALELVSIQEDFEVLET